MDRRDVTDRHRYRIRWLDSLRLVVGACAIALVVMGMYVMRESSRSRGWRTVDGRVVSSSVNEFVGKDGVIYQPMIMYAYSIGSVRYMSNRIGFQPSRSRSRRDVEKILSHYPAGRVVRVTYNPLEPDRAVLEPAGNPWTWLAAGGVLSLVTVAMRIRRGQLEKRVRTAQRER